MKSRPNSVHNTLKSMKCMLNMVDFIIKVTGFILTKFIEESTAVVIAFPRKGPVRGLFY